MYNSPKRVSQLTEGDGIGKVNFQSELTFLVKRSPGNLRDMGEIMDAIPRKKWIHLILDALKRKHFVKCNNHSRNVF